jgi:hypothetical protein
MLRIDHLLEFPKKCGHFSVLFTTCRELQGNLSTNRDDGNKKNQKNSQSTLSHALSPADMPNPWCFRAETALRIGAWKAEFFLIRCRLSGLYAHDRFVNYRNPSRRTQSGPYFKHRFIAFVFLSDSVAKCPLVAIISKKKKQPGAAVCGALGRKTAAPIVGLLFLLLLPSAFSAPSA